MPEMVRNRPVKVEVAQEHLANRRIHETKRQLDPKERRAAEELRQATERYVQTGRRLPKALVAPGPAVIQNAFQIVRSELGEVAPRAFIQAVVKGIERLAFNKRMDPAVYLQGLFRQNAEPEQKPALIIVFYQLGKEAKTPPPSTVASVNFILSLPENKAKEEAVSTIGLKFDQFVSTLNLLFEQYQRQIEKGLKTEEDKEVARALLIKKKIEELLELIAGLNKAPLPA